MTTKTTAKREQVTHEPPVDERPELETACQIHTLAQMLYGHIAMTRPWVHAVPPPVMGPDPGAGIQATGWAQPITGVCGRQGEWPR